MQKILAVSFLLGSFIHDFIWSSVFAFTMKIHVDVFEVLYFPDILLLWTSSSDSSEFLLKLRSLMKTRYK